MSEPRPVVLFVDDEMVLLGQFAKVLKYDGYDVLSAGRADDALDLIDGAERIDIAVLDLHLPIEGSDQIPAMLKGDGGELGLLLDDRFPRSRPRSISASAASKSWLRDIALADLSVARRCEGSK